MLHASVDPGGGAEGGDRGQLSRDHPKQGPNSQLEGLRRRHVALTDQILQIAQGRTGCPLADGRISSTTVSPPHSPFPLPYVSLQTGSRSHLQSHPVSSLSLYLTVLSSSWLLRRVPGDVEEVIVSTLGLKIEVLPGLCRPLSHDCGCSSCIFSPPPL